MQGTVLKIDVKSDEGIICAENGKRLTFCPQKADGVAVRGVVVDFVEDNDKAVDVVVVKTSWFARFDWLMWFLFSWQGRISRAQFLWYVTAACLIVPLSPVPFRVLTAWTGLCVVTKRFHDTGRSFFWVAAALLCAAATGTLAFLPSCADLATTEVMTVCGAVDVLTGLFVLYLCFADGNICPNKYGKEPYVCMTKCVK